MSLRNLMMGGGSSGGSSGGVIATLTMVAGTTGVKIGYSNPDNSNFGTMTPDTFVYNGVSITINELYYWSSRNKTRYSFGYTGGYPDSITMRIGETILTTDGSRGYFENTYEFANGETYTIEILSVTL